MHWYTVRVARRAVKSIAGLPRKEQLRVSAALDLLSGDPLPPGCVALTGEDSVYRVRVGDYRILYEVIDTRRVIQVIRVSHRRDAYRRR